MQQHAFICMNPKAHVCTPLCCSNSPQTTQAFKRLAQAMTRISLALKLSSSIYSKVLSALEAGIGAKAPAVAPKEGEVQRAAEAEGGSLATGACQLLWLLIQGSRTRQQQAAGTTAVWC